MAFVCMISSPLAARDYILEFKAAYFKPTSTPFKCLYDGSALFGPELTFQLSECYPCLYGFASVDYFSKKGRSLGLGDCTEVRMVPLALGIKYFIPYSCADFYVGLGFQPTHVKTDNYAPGVACHTSQWALGGIIKLGSYIDLGCDWLLDIFIDYSFARLDCERVCAPGFVTTQKTDTDGAIFGAGLGYRF